MVEDSRPIKGNHQCSEHKSHKRSYGVGAENGKHRSISSTNDASTCADTVDKWLPVSAGHMSARLCMAQHVVSRSKKCQLEVLSKKCQHTTCFLRGEAHMYE